MSAVPASVPRPSVASCCAPSVGDNPTLPAERLAATAKALSEPGRVRIVDVLLRSEEAVCQCELNALLGLKQPVLSHHMKKLVEAGLVDVERRHKWAYYSISSDAFQELTSWLR